MCGEKFKKLTFILKFRSKEYPPDEKQNEKECKASLIFIPPFSWIFIVIFPNIVEMTEKQFLLMFARRDTVAPSDAWSCWHYATM